MDASASARCQKCLQSGHWTFDCKNERAYKPRPSRTALLANPSLRLPEATFATDSLEAARREATAHLSGRGQEAGASDEASSSLSSSSSSSDGEGSFDSESSVLSESSSDEEDTDEEDTDDDESEAVDGNDASGNASEDDNGNSSTFSTDSDGAEDVPKRPRLDLNGLDGEEHCGSQHLSSRQERLSEPLDSYGDAVSSVRNAIPR